VSEIIDALREQPAVRATPFIGQSASKGGVKGTSSKQQQEIIRVCASLSIAFHRRML
jgi:hypothetical protein